jgi:hypothetical protein
MDLLTSQETLTKPLSNSISPHHPYKPPPMVSHQIENRSKHQSTIATHTHTKVSNTTCTYQATNPTNKQSQKFKYILSINLPSKTPGRRSTLLHTETHKVAHHPQTPPKDQKQMYHPSWKPPPLPPTITKTNKLPTTQTPKSQPKTRVHRHKPKTGVDPNKKYSLNQPTLPKHRAPNLPKPAPTTPSLTHHQKRHKQPNKARRKCTPSTPPTLLPHKLHPNTGSKQNTNLTKTKLPQISPNPNARHCRRPGRHTPTPCHSKKNYKHLSKNRRAPEPKQVATHLHPQSTDPSLNQPNPQPRLQIPHPPTYFLTHLLHSATSPTHLPPSVPSPKMASSKDTTMKPATRLEIDLRNRNNRTRSSGTEDRHPLQTPGPHTGREGEKLDSARPSSTGPALALNSKLTTDTLQVPK